MAGPAGSPAGGPRFYFPDIEEMPVPAGHRFPAGKYRLLREEVLRRAILAPDMLHASPPATREALLSAHAAAYVDAMTEGTLGRDAMRRIGLPWSGTLVRRAKATVGGSVAAARSALEVGLSGQLAGGTHHAHRDFGSGFCVFNDLAVTCLTLLEDGSAGRIAILDLDVHQGDGNAAILASDPRVFVVGIQGERNFPFHRVPGDIDIELPDGTEDDAYLSALADVLPAVEGFRPDLVLYLAGVDPLREDKLGRLGMSHAGIAARDRMVLSLCRLRGLPVAIAIGGGYAEPIGASVTAYANTFAVAREVYGF